MGRAIAAEAKTKDNLKIVCGVDISECKDADFPVYKSLAEVKEDADIIVDYSHHSTIFDVLCAAKTRKIPAVIATTGHTDSEISAINEASGEIAIFRTGNMSLGVNLLMSLAKEAASMLGIDYNIEIIEKHHNQKLDAPSGTAIMIANAIAEATPFEPNYVYDRHGERKKRAPEDIGIHSVRGGGIVGEHEVIFAGEKEVLTISHSAADRSLFSSGTLRAVEFMYGKKSGMYSMDDYIKSLKK